MQWLITAISLFSLGRADSQVLQRQNQGLSNPVWNNIVDVASSSPDVNSVTPLFWHIHKAGGTTLHDFWSSCLNLTLAAEVGVLDGHQMDQVRHIVDVEGCTSSTRGPNISRVPPTSGGKNSTWPLSRKMTGSMSMLTQPQMRVSSGLMLWVSKTRLI